MARKKSTDAGSAVATAFGSANRARLIGEYFASNIGSPKAPQFAWLHVYRLLLWLDPTTGLAHCYESDKCQPGKPWYGRSLAFHRWLATTIGVEPGNVGKEIDWLFEKAAAQLAEEALQRRDALAATASKQRTPYEGYPVPGEDPELIAIIREVLGDHLATEPPPEAWGRLVSRIREYLQLDNKRKNLLGEGFEDLLAAIVRRSCTRDGLDVRTRVALHEVRGFHRGRQDDKPNKVDLAVLCGSHRILVSAKWSVRADREKQFEADHDSYSAANTLKEPFEYVFVTNEFDPARLVHACETMSGNARMFQQVVHITTEGLVAAYGQHPNQAMRRVLEHVASDRITSLESWLQALRAR